MRPNNHLLRHMMTRTRTRYYVQGRYTLVRHWSQTASTYTYQLTVVTLLLAQMTRGVR